MRPKSTIVGLPLAFGLPRSEVLLVYGPRTRQTLVASLPVHTLIVMSGIGLWLGVLPVTGTSIKQPV